MFNYISYIKFLSKNIDQLKYHNADKTDRFNNTLDDYQKEIEKFTKLAIEEYAKSESIELKSKEDYANVFKGLVEEKFEKNQTPLTVDNPEKYMDFKFTSKNNLHASHYIDMIESIGNKSIDLNKKFENKMFNPSLAKQFAFEDYYHKYSTEAHLNSFHKMSDLSEEAEKLVDGWKEIEKGYREDHNKMLNIYKCVSKFQKDDPEYDSMGDVVLNAFKDYFSLEYDSKSKSLVTKDDSYVSFYKEQMIPVVGALGRLQKRYQERNIFQKFGALLGFGQAAREQNAINQMKGFLVNNGIDKDSLDNAIVDAVKGHLKSSIDLEAIMNFLPLKDQITNIDEFVAQKGLEFAENEINLEQERLQTYTKEEVKEAVEEKDIQKVSDKVMDEPTMNKEIKALE